MADLKLEINDEVVMHENVNMQQVNGEHHEAIEQGFAPLASAVPAGMTPAPTLLDVVLKQLPLPEQMGFLRGNIMLLSARIGTPDGDPRDGERLDQFNFLFQMRLRLMVQENLAHQQKHQADMDAMQRQADEDARSRGFKSHDDMGESLKTLYESICERVKQWHASTEPGGDPLAAPETDALLYDVYLVTEGRAR